MFFHILQIEDALRQLADVQTFYCTTFLVMKLNNIPIGEAIEFNIIREDERFMERFYKPHPTSAWFYRVSRTSDKARHWLRPDYPGKGLQKVRSQEPFRSAFIHETGTNLWGWQPDYVKALKNGLYRGRRIPMYALAVWLFRDIDFKQPSPDGLLNQFVREFNLTGEEIDTLFDLSTPSSITTQDEPVTWGQLRTIIRTLPPDAPEEEDGILAYLELRNIGPADSFNFKPLPRINLITGDNGLGKSFILECAWWALTGQWIDLPAYPTSPNKVAEISFQIASDIAVTDMTSVTYNREFAVWDPKPKGQTRPGLLIYARADNSFAVWDPAQRHKASSWRNEVEHIAFSWDEVWNGKRVEDTPKTRVISRGLIDDWIIWQSSQDKQTFNTFTKVLSYLSPDDYLILRPGNPVVLPDDARDIPTLVMPYGEVALVHASEGMKRVIAIAYLLVWAWNEHQRQSRLAGIDPKQHMILLIDELEAHLHPKWQSVILPALLKVSSALDPHLQVQFLIATHSPIILTSIEPFFDRDRDQLFHLDLIRTDLFGEQVRLEAISFERQGTANSWLSSSVFDVSPRSPEATMAIEQAIEILEMDNPTPDEVEQANRLLLRTLSAKDEFWPRWIFFAEQYGVQF